MRGLLTEQETEGSWRAFLQRKELEGAGEFIWMKYSKIKPFCKRNTPQQQNSFRALYFDAASIHKKVLEITL